VSVANPRQNHDENFEIIQKIHRNRSLPCSDGLKHTSSEFQQMSLTGFFEIIQKIQLKYLILLSSFLNKFLNVGSFKIASDSILQLSAKGFCEHVARFRCATRPQE
jgi:hypothetical protein